MEDSQYFSEHALINDCNQDKVKFSILNKVHVWQNIVMRTMLNLCQIAWIVIDIYNINDMFEVDTAQPTKENFNNRLKLAKNIS